ncbi:hypothetical protein CKM354_000275000 [Cercospora kikuchii]|uniref:SAP domain-containing protein n=1 Tax=Cercospora kikuchii TaxID=84275 RepID=A0A9P3F9X9_9PEZI|nr:uncharacterized protein CKM354_000275000 [Cercospora kikuchii]GIZ39363.1 hypothetical protein CKM354_000275000 [Cercospora kikuchii]
MVDYSKKKNDELAALCKARNLPHSGKKADLVKRLEEHDAKESSASETPAEKPAVNEDEIDWDDEPAADTAKPTTTQATAASAAVADQSTVEGPAKGNDTEAAEPTTSEQPAPTADDSAADAEAQKKRKEEEDATFRAGLDESTLDQEIEKRKARRARFGITEDDEELKRLERAKRFGTATLAGLADLNKALPASEDRKQKKRGREANESDSGVRKKSKGRAAPPAKKQGGEKAKTEKSSNGYPSWMTEKDIAAANARKAKFAA